MESAIVPPIFCPFPQEINPHVKEVQQHVLAWVQRFGLVQKEIAQQRFRRADFGWFAACVYPSVDIHDLELVSDWFAWLFLVDDQLDDGVLGVQLEKARKIMGDLLAVIDDAHGSDLHLVNASVQSSAVIAALVDLWQRTALHTQVAWRKRFYRHFANCFAAACWEAENRIRGIIPDVTTYIHKRRDTGAIYICLDLIDVVKKMHFPVQIYDHPVFQTLLDTSSNVICWCNDIFSLEKEVERGEYHNLVPVLQHAQQCSLQEAVNSANALITTEVRHFLEAERQMQGLFPAYTQDIQTYLAGMKSWMRGNLAWSSATERYVYVEQAQSRETVNYLDSIL